MREFEEDRRRPDARQIIAGNLNYFPIRVWAGLILVLVVIITSGILWILSSGIIPAELTIPDGVFTGVLYINISASVLMFLLIAVAVFFRIFPLRARALWSKQSASENTRRVAFKLARGWRKYSVRTVSPVEIKGDAYFPGLETVRPHTSTSIEIVLILPPGSLPEGRIKYIGSVATELATMVDAEVDSIGLDRTKEDRAIVVLLVEDMTSQVREVAV